MLGIELESSLHWWLKSHSCISDRKVSMISLIFEILIKAEYLVNNQCWLILLLRPYAPFVVKSIGDVVMFHCFASGQCNSWGCSQPFLWSIYSQYLNLVKSMPSASHVGRTKLDKERLKLCQYEVESVCQSAQELKGSTKDDTHIKDNLKAANALLQRLLNIAIEVSAFPFRFKKRWKQALNDNLNGHKDCARWPWLLLEFSKC